jgi:hypothetical protein
MDELTLEKDIASVSSVSRNLTLDEKVDVDQHISD